MTLLTASQFPLLSDFVLLWQEPKTQQLKGRESDLGSLWPDDTISVGLW